MSLPMMTRRAFTLVELLVVIVIIVIMMGMILAAIQRVRAAAQRVRCENNLHQIGIALGDYGAKMESLPSNGGWDGVQTIPSKDGTPFTPETYVTYNELQLRWGTGDPKLTPKDQTGSWLYVLLPYIEADKMFQDRIWTQPEPMYICPVRRAADPDECVAGDAYCDYLTGGWAWGKTDYAGSSFAFPVRPKCRSNSEFTRGLSQTILVGEKAYDASIESGTWFFDEPFFLGGSASTTRGGNYIYRDGAGMAFKHNWGSKHNGGANFLFGDGSVRILPFDTDPSTMQAYLRLQ